ncbi:MAG: thiol oxidoreductase [Betaproteobacteria bacterium]|nr:MAG: thiol oxidoreductase [Betaproteobacteria bacterium]
MFTAGPAWTSAQHDETAYSMPIADLSKKQGKRFVAGQEAFNEAWVVAPEPGVWGLGPTFNEDRCSHCHEANGRSPAVDDGGEAIRGPLVRLSIAGKDEFGAPSPHPAYGDQFQNRGIEGRVPPEGKVIVNYMPREVKLADGEIVTLREPNIEFAELQFGDMGKSTMTSLRVAPQLVGLGLLEAVPDETLLAIAERQLEQGVSGRPNYVWDIENERRAMGRFGWKANQPSVRQQTAAAFMGDIGATTYLFQQENCPAVQTQCLDTPSAASCGGQGGCTGNAFRPEVNPSRLTNLSLYLRTLAVPARRNASDPAVRHGEELFERAQCSTCHIPELQTAAADRLPHDIKAAADVTIRPYTDMLLHDMGPDLADGRPDFEASGSEWRTPPLWGIGLLPTVNGHSDLLHDGRARNVTEAILWHGGEAKAARERFRQMSAEDRMALVKFVESL